MTHTPGEWTAEYNHIVARDDAGLVNNDGNSIARLYGPDIDANATLIAAAPELLETCKAAYDLLGGIRITATAQADAHEVYSKLGNALGKVEGEQ